MAYNYKITGRTRVRVTAIRHRLVLQVECRDDFYKHLIVWRDATLDDLQEIGEAQALLPVLEKIQAAR